MKLHRALTATALLAVVLLSLACTPPRGARDGAQVSAGQAPAYNEQAVANYYSGKTLKFLVGLAPGGGYDTYTRAIARHFAKHVPGNPAVIVDNMTGGGSLVAANAVHAGGRPDGLTVLSWIGTLSLAQVLGQEGIEFDSRRVQYLGVPTPDSNVCALRKEAGIRSGAELLAAPEVIMGGVAPGSPTDDTPRVLAAALGFNLKMVSGYGGTAPIRQAADSGEVQGGCWAWESVKVTWKAGLDAGDVNVVLQATGRKLPDLPNVDLAQDLAKTEEAKQLIQYGIVVPGQISRAYSVHPDTPADRVQALRKAFMDTMQDPEFLDEAKKAGLDVVPIGGEEEERLVKELFNIPENIKAKLKPILVAS